MQCLHFGGELINWKLYLIKRLLKINQLPDNNREPILLYFVMVNGLSPAYGQLKIEFKSKG